MVYVLARSGKPLMPCRNVIARLLLKQGKAKCVHRTPFTIQLLYDSSEYTQFLIIAIDSGSKTIGSAVRDGQNKIYYLSEVVLRQDIKSKMDQRRMYRQTRRARKTRYRKPRFLNRANSTKTERYVPTIRSKFETTLKEITFVSQILPVKKLVIETGTFDPHALQNPAVKYCPWLYQKGIQFGYYNVKAYVLSRDNYTCQYCKNKRKDSRLHVHHILARSNGGSDRPNNLITLCKSCHDDLHLGLLSLSKTQLKSTLNHATHMNVLQSLFRKKVNYTETYGYITKAIREYFGIIKSHCYDAACIGIEKDIIPEFLVDYILLKRAISRGTYQRTHGSRSEKLFPKDKIAGFKRWDRVKYDGDIFFIKGRMSSGYAKLSDIAGNEIKLSPMAKFSRMERVSARKSWIMIEDPIQSI